MQNANKTEGKKEEKSSNSYLLHFTTFELLFPKCHTSDLKEEEKKAKSSFSNSVSKDFFDDFS
jgi:hypothetical protein